MKKEDKSIIIEELKNKLSESNTFYITDSSTLTVEAVNELRRMCFENGIEMRVAKNTLIKKAMEASETDFEELYPILKGPTSLMFSTVANAPAKTIKKFRAKFDKPVLKAAFVESSVYLGDDQVEVLANLKSKEELIADILALLQSPAKNVISGLQSGGSKLSGILKTLSEKSE